MASRVALFLLVLVLPLVLAFVPLHCPTTSTVSTQQPLPSFHNKRAPSRRLFLFRSPEQPPSAAVNIPDLSEETSKFRRLKDLMWVRETKEDLTAAEFACSIDIKGGQKHKKRAIDYDNLLSQLDRRIRDLVCGDDGECQATAAKETLTPGKGSGAIVYTEEQRDALLK